MNYTENINLHWYNIPEIYSKTVTIKDIFFRKLYTKSGLKKGTPMILYMLNGTIDGLDKLRHSEEARGILNRRGLHIYLYEPICSKIKASDDFSAGFYGEFPYDSTLNDLFCAEFESIKKYVTRNNLTSVTVHTCDYEVDKYYTGYSKYFKVICDDIFLRNQNFNGILDDEYKKTTKFKKKFICQNWRYTSHRHLTSSFLQDKDCHISWYFRASVEQLKSKLWFDLLEWADHFPDVYNKIISGATNLKVSAPLFLDVKTETNTRLNGNQGYQNIYPNVYQNVNPCLLNNRRDSLGSFYKDSFCSIVTESRFAQPTANVSEKTLMPMHFRRPFIIIGPPRTIKYLKELGFKTFHEHWDESYDEVEQHDTRLLKIFELIDNIYSMSDEDVHKMYCEMLPILNYNENKIVEMYNGSKA